MERHDLTGRQFGLWTAIEYSGEKDKFGVLLWICRCQCGTQRPVKASNLRSGTSTNCGCQGRNFKHGLTKTRTFKSWDSMRQRCLNPNDPTYHRYGARGISICERWSSFEAFLADMGERPDGTSLDRIKNDQGYEPGNCRWATPKEQQANRDVTLFITANGVRKTLREWAAELNVPPSTLQSRIAKGWQPDDVVSVPIRPKRAPRTSNQGR